MASMFPGGMPGGMQGMPGGAAEPPKEVDNGKMVDLLDKIDKSDTYAKNEAASFPMTNLFIGDSRLGCKSDADEQLILHIAFQEFVKVRIVNIMCVNQKSKREFSFFTPFPPFYCRFIRSSLQNSTMESIRN